MIYALDSFTFADCMVSLDISEALSQLIAGISAIACCWNNLIALESSAGSGQGITCCYLILTS